MCLHLMLVNVYSQWHRFGSKSGGGGREMVGRVRVGSLRQSLHTHTHILVNVLNKPSQYWAMPQFWEWGTKQCCERSEHKIFGFLPQIVTFLGTLVANEVQKIVEYICIEGKKAVCVPSYLGAWPKVGGQTTLRPHPKFWGTRPPFPCDLRHCVQWWI